MSIVKMKKLRVIALRAQRDELMQALLRLGCVEVHAPDDTLSDPEAAALLRPEKAELARLRTELMQMTSAVRILEQYVPEKKKLLAARPQISQKEFLDADALERDLALAERICDRESQLRRITADQARICTEIESLRPWEPMDESLDGAGTKTCAVALFSSPAEVHMESVADAAETVTESVQIILVSADEAQHYFMVIALREELEAVANAVRAIGCSQVTFPGVADTAKEAIASRIEELAVLSSRKKKLEGQITELGAKLPALRLSIDRMQTEVSRAEAIERLAGTDSIVVLEGWCPESEAGSLQKTLSGLDCAWEFSDPAPEEYPNVPVKLKNRGFIAPINMVTEMYSLPAYNGVDPNPLMWPFFIFFYGFMMADMGYGLVMLLAGLVALKKLKPRGGMANMAGLLCWGGVSTMIFGALTGGFFGDFLPQLAQLINPDTAFTAMPALFSPVDDALAVLIVSLALGLVQIFAGMGISAWKKTKDGDVWGAVLEEGTWLVILLGTALTAVKITPVVLIVGGVMLLAGSARKAAMGGAKGAKLIFSTLGGIGGSIYNNATGYFSDILSYSRLMALMLAGAVIAQVFNTLGAITGNVLFFIVISFVGNVLNFALNLLGCFVHDMRLQCLEFFGRFYEDGGKPFTPLAAQTNYVDVIKD